MLSDDSGHSSLATYTADSRKSMNKDGRKNEGEGGRRSTGGQDNNNWPVSDTIYTRKLALSKISIKNEQGYIKD